MKKIAVIVVLTGMFAWAVYDLAISSDNTETAQDTQTAEESEFTVEEGSLNKDEDGGTANDESSESGNPEDSTDDSGENADSDTVGLEVGNIAPDFQLETLDGEQVALSDYRGRRVMVNFWATWCPPCRAEMPDMQSFYEDKDVEILAINLTGTESSREGVTDFTNEFGLTFPILMDEDTQVANEYQIQPIPSSFMIDSNGRIQYKALGAMNYEMMVQQFEMMQ
ncbi:redoxin domain-containing protein [Lentibacillus amyloliquefaciens]|uniref:Alkyl hydroperoxide reductase n=1 Tax=Lentibacillus amyloliquefaciens TaxID=1472767 RepID=A0A0U4E6W0_9BACI|nr:redoxin domain-containing protein [Lentibacillus amyloliquefaciens]ALX49020.1 alkyl hydroperoxide reductase [Lentibacillus amyloliquefaciens]